MEISKKFNLINLLIDCFSCSARRPRHIFNHRMTWVTPELRQTDICIATRIWAKVIPRLCIPPLHTVFGHQTIAFTVADCQLTIITIIGHRMIGFCLPEQVEFQRSCWKKRRVAGHRGKLIPVKRTPNSAMLVVRVWSVSRTTATRALQAQSCSASRTQSPLPSTLSTTVTDPTWWPRRSPAGSAPSPTDLRSWSKVCGRARTRRRCREVCWGRYGTTRNCSRTPVATMRRSFCCGYWTLLMMSCTDRQDSTLSGR